MGGAAAGDVASQLGLDTLFAELLKGMNNGLRKSLSADDLLKVCVERSNRRLWEESQMNIDFRGMGTTLTAALVYGPFAYIAEVGDSRAYVLRSKRIEQVTKDQSAVQALIDLGRLTKEEAATAPNRNIILQALGVEPSVQVALTRVALRRGDYLLICSDGLSNKVAEEELRNIVLSPNQIDAACRNLIELANIRGGEDNITVVLARFDGEGLPAPNENEPISATVKVISDYCPAEARRELHTSQFAFPDQLRVEG
jgi:serine/threonine protein phosphatase PrpC